MVHAVTLEWNSHSHPFNRDLKNSLRMTRTRTKWLPVPDELFPVSVYRHSRIPFLGYRKTKWMLHHW